SLYGDISGVSYQKESGINSSDGTLLCPAQFSGAPELLVTHDLIGINSNIRRVRRLEFYWALIAFVGVVMLGTLQGIVAAVIVSLLLLLHQANNPPVYAVGRKRGTDVFRPLSEEHPDDETFPGLLMLRVVGRVYFGNPHRVSEKMAPLIAHA